MNGVFEKEHKKKLKIEVSLKERTILLTLILNFSKEGCFALLESSYLL